MKALHISLGCLQISFRMNGKFCLCMSIRQSDAAVTRTCNQLQIMGDDENSLFLPHLPDQCRAPLQTFRVLSCCRLVQYDDRLVG